MLKTNTSLTSVILSENNFGTEGMKKLEEALKTNTTLTELDLEEYRPEFTRDDDRPLILKEGSSYDPTSPTNIKRAWIGIA